MLNKIYRKILNNIQIYKHDLKTKGIYWSIVHRIYKLPKGKLIFTPIVNILKPSFLVLDGHKFYIDKSDAVISQELILSGKWEEYETELFKKYVKKDDVVLDIGAHIGYYTLLAARLVGTKGIVYAFEPDPKNFRLLKKNVEENRYENVVLINKAVADINGEMMFFLNSENTGDHRIYDSGDQRKFIKIKSITLDNFFKNKPKKVDFIKMDIQGSEVRAFKGAQKIIKVNKDVKILTEFSPYGLELSGSSSQEYAELLKKNMFKIFNINESEKTIKLIDSKALLTPLESKDHNYRYLLCMR